MTINKFHLSLLKEDKIYALKTLENLNLQKSIKEDKKFIEIEINTDSKEYLDTELIANKIVSLIMDILKSRVLKEYIQKEYENFYATDKEQIYNCSIGVFQQKEKFLRESIHQRIHGYIVKNNYINIEGFVNFRMKEFLKYISTIVDLAAEEYIIEKDYNEFISVLRYFIEIQDKKIDFLKIYLNKDNTFTLCDKYENKIENINDEDIINMVLKENLNYEDFLISTLLTLCPRKIEIIDNLNNNSSKEIIKTIKSIFENDVKITYTH